MRKLIDYIYTHWDHTLRYTPNDEGEMIGMPNKFTSPSIGPLHSALFYWDTYFTNEGLLLSDKLDYAIGNTENIAFLINKYGYMPNGSRTRFLGRSQPPFFSLMVNQIYDCTGDKSWLSRMYSALEKEWAFWQSERQTSLGLNRYYHNLGDIETAPIILQSEVEKRMPFFKKTDRESLYNLTAYYRVVCESGWDCSSRIGFDNCDFAWVDLNALLYGLESNMVYFSNELSIDGGVWKERAEKRKALMNEYLWDEEREMFCDYDLSNCKKSDFLTAAAYYPLFVGMASDEQAKAMADKVCLLEREYGLAATEERDEEFKFQWDYPRGWAPLHYIMIKGLHNYGYTDIARRNAEKYCKLVERAFEESGDIWEKYDVETGKPATSEGGQRRMMGWSAGVYLWCRRFADGEI